MEIHPLESVRWRRHPVEKVSEDRETHKRQMRAYLVTEPFAYDYAYESPVPVQSLDPDHCLVNDGARFSQQLPVRLIWHHNVYPSPPGS